jgi:protocatechuate 3,4-dioxygenase beta subunit
MATSDLPPRRGVLRTLLTLGAASQLTRPFAGMAQTQPLAPTPSCGAPARSTAAQTEGPYFMRASPQRQSLLEANTAGERLRLSGRVLDTRCQPIAKALLDFWQADAGGAYDNRGFTLRSHQFSDATGGFVLDTVMPGLYPGRTRHIHVKVQAPGGRVLTTQLYFPGEAGNQRDGIFAPELLVTLQRGGATALAGFDFVLLS